MTLIFIRPAQGLLTALCARSQGGVQDDAAARRRGEGRGSEAQVLRMHSMKCAFYCAPVGHERAARACRADDEVKESGTRADIKQLFDLAWKHRSHQFARYATRPRRCNHVLMLSLRGAGTKSHSWTRGLRTQRTCWRSLRSASSPPKGA